MILVRFAGAVVGFAYAHIITIAVRMLRHPVVTGSVCLGGALWYVRLRSS